MNMQFNLDNLRNRFGRKAKEYADDNEKTEDLINKAKLKAEKIEKGGPLDQLYQRLQLLFAVVKDWKNGSYKHIPKGSIIMIIMGLLYFMSPFDLVFDLLPGGFFDDAFVLGLVIKQVNSDIEKYKKWKLEESYYRGL